jgi:hypothetical protein
VGTSQEGAAADFAIIQPKHSLYNCG